MLLVLLKTKNKIYFKVVNDDDALINYIDTTEKKIGEIELDKSIIITGEVEIVNNIETAIKELFCQYDYDHKIDETKYNSLIGFIKGLEFTGSNRDIQITYGIVIEETFDEPLIEFPSYTIYIYVDNQSITISLDEVSNIPHFQSKSYSITFENLDEIISIFEGLRYDLSELIKESNDRIITIELVDNVDDFIETKLTMMPWKNIPNHGYMNGSKKYPKIKKNDPDVPEISDTKEYLTASEVLKKLRISDQTLAKWRRSGKIKCKQISTRKYLYHISDVVDIIDNGISETSEIAEKKEKTVTKVIEEIKKEINYEEEVVKLLQPFTYKIPDYKYKQQNFFLNFGNIGIISSPQVMISNDYQLVDYIKKNVICDNAKELFEYISVILDDGKTPTIDSSKIVQPGYSVFYLNNLRKSNAVSYL